MGFGYLKDDCFQQKPFSKQVSRIEAHRILHAPAALPQVIYRMVSRASFTRRFKTWIFGRWASNAKSPSDID
jgi:hypothetical protein